jgi:hypothetical protein
MARQRAPSEWILGNGNLYAGQRSLIVGHSHKPFFRQFKDRRRNMEQTVYNPQKGMMVTIDITFMDKNTTWFDEADDTTNVSLITDFEDDLVIAN